MPKPRAARAADPFLVERIDRPRIEVLGPLDIRADAQYADLAEVLQCADEVKDDPLVGCGMVVQPLLDSDRHQIIRIEPNVPRLLCGWPAGVWYTPACRS